MHKKEKKKKGPIGPEKEEEEADKLEIFFCKIHDFHNPVSVVPAEIPPRYAINFVPAAPVPLFPRASSVAPVSFNVPAKVLVPAELPAHFVPASAIPLLILLLLFLLFPVRPLPFPFPPRLLLFHLLITPSFLLQISFSQHVLS